MYLKLLILITYISYISLYQKCEVKRVDKSKIPRVELYTKDEANGNLRDLQKQTIFQPLRIYIDYTHLNNQLSTSTINSNQFSLVKTIMENSVVVYEELLLVSRSRKRLAIPECNNLDLDNNILDGSGVDADVLMIPFVDTRAGSNVEASASYCIQESMTGRPVAGSIGFGTIIDFSKANSKYYYTLLAIHEMNHILCFHMDLFEYYIDSRTGEPYRNGVTQDILVNGLLKTIVTTPKVVEMAKKHFNCENVVGVELEDQGGPGTAGSHWEMRVMYGDYMIGQSIEEVVISEISLAMFEDSGWYKVNYYTGGLHRYGKDEGCRFLDSNCVIDGTTKFPEEFSTVMGQPMCFGGRSAKGVSSLVRYTRAISNEYQYFLTDPAKGGIENADFCPVATSVMSKSVWYSNSCNLGSSAYPTGLGEMIGPDSYCFVSSLTKIGDATLSKYVDKARTICHAIHCDTDTRTISVVVGEILIECPQAGGVVQVPGYKGILICPDYNKLCTKSIACNNTLDCVMKHSVPLNNVLDYVKDPATTANDATAITPGGVDNPTNANANQDISEKGTCFFFIFCSASSVKMCLFSIIGIVYLALF
jgi:hypothetical protein